jgi:predicted RNA binding protein YcfA (HicA-like mRNA interferase family)
MAVVETNTRKIIARLTAEGWKLDGGGEHDKYRHPQKKFTIMVPRHRMLSPGTARAIAKQAGWLV